MEEEIDYWLLAIRYLLLKRQEETGCTGVRT
jgi:hypothetical protein